jgi:hypothetical protein
MAHITITSPWRARGTLRHAYQEVRRQIVGGWPLPLPLAIWNIMRVFSLRPALVRAFGRCFLLTMWGGTLRRQAREALGVTVAQRIRCPY